MLMVQNPDRTKNEQENPVVSLSIARCRDDPVALRAYGSSTAKAAVREAVPGAGQ